MELRLNQRCTGYFQDFLNLIQNHMLVVEPSVTNPNQSFRYSCKGVEDTLKRMYKNRHQSGYLVQTSLP
jgi:hypothetical protein